MLVFFDYMNLVEVRAMFDDLFSVGEHEGEGYQTWADMLDDKTVVGEGRDAQEGGSENLFRFLAPFAVGYVIILMKYFPLSTYMSQIVWYDSRRYVTFSLLKKLKKNMTDMSRKIDIKNKSNEIINFHPYKLVQFQAPQWALLMGP